MLKDVSLAFIVLPFFIGGIFYSKISKHKTGDKLRDSIKNLQIMLTMTGVLCFIMFLLLPSTPVLSSFGYPETVNDIDSKEEILKLFQEYNHAIVRTTEVIHWFLFILIFWIGTSVYQLLQLYRNRLDEQIALQHDEKTN